MTTPANVSHVMGECPRVTATGDTPVSRRNGPWADFLQLCPGSAATACVALNQQCCWQMVINKGKGLK